MVSLATVLGRFRVGGRCVGVDRRASGQVRALRPRRQVLQVMESLATRIWAGPPNIGRMIGVVLVLLALFVAGPIGLFVAGALWSAGFGWFASDDADRAADAQPSAS
jgi:hypothetical protein